MYKMASMHDRIYILYTSMVHMSLMGKENKQREGEVTCQAFICREEQMSNFVA